MYCMRCGAAIAANSRFCPSCGSPQSAPAQQGVPYPSIQQMGPLPGVATPAPQVTINFRRLGAGDIIAGISTIVVFISLFLPWYTVGVGTTLSVSALNSLAGGWRYLVLVLCLLIVIYLFVRTFLVRGARLPLPHWQLMTSLTVVNGLLVILMFLVKPNFAQLLSQGGISTSWGYGAFIGLVAAVAAVIGSIVRRNEPENLIGVPSVQHAWQQPPPPGVWTVAPQGGATQGDAPGPATGSPQPAQAPAAVPNTGVSCSRCGTQVAGGNQYCNGCGAPVQ